MFKLKWGWYDGECGSEEFDDKFDAIEELNECKYFSDVDYAYIMHNDDCIASYDKAEDEYCRFVREG